MKNLRSFNNWLSLNEATLNDSKSEVVYTISRPGREKIKAIGNLSPDIIFEPVSVEPDDDTEVIHIRPSSFRQITYSEFKRIHEIENPLEEIFIYETSSVIFPFAVAIKGTKTNMIAQKFREGSSARGDYFRETAFIITLARRLWTKHGVQVKIASNRGVIPMIYENNGESYPDPPRADFRNKYWQFMDKPRIGEAMIQQCDGLINRLGDSCKRIKVIQKNSVDLSINKFFKLALTKEREKIAKDSSNYHFIPDRVALPKWNPSDIWIAYDKCQWMVSDRVESVENRFKRLKINGLQDLNEFLSQSITSLDGLIGVSLKQQLIDCGRVYDINVDTKKRFIHSYKSYQASSTTKTVKLLFGFKMETLAEILAKADVEPNQQQKTKEGEGQIDVRTFSTEITSPISVEVKGSKKSGHMSGKAGSYIKYIMDEDYRILSFIQKSKDTNEISRFMQSKEGYKFTDKNLEKIFYDDLSIPKNDVTNSRLQAVFFTDWLTSLRDDLTRDGIINDIVRFAKSESNWSSAHLLVK